MIQNLNEELFSFIKKSPTGFHAVHRIGRIHLIRILRVGFRRNISACPSRELEMSCVGIAVGGPVTELADRLV